LKRSFKGKYIKHLINLIWFWEKVSRLLSYTIRRMYNNFDSDII
jgi:hypothetical protein